MAIKYDILEGSNEPQAKNDPGPGIESLNPVIDTVSSLQELRLPPPPYRPHLFLQIYSIFIDSNAKRYLAWYRLNVVPRPPFIWNNRETMGRNQTMIIDSCRQRVEVSFKWLVRWEAFLGNNSNVRIPTTKGVVSENNHQVTNNCRLRSIEHQYKLLRFDSLFNIRRFVNYNKPVKNEKEAPPLLGEIRPDYFLIRSYFATSNEHFPTAQNRTYPQHSSRTFTRFDKTLA